MHEIQLPRHLAVIRGALQMRPIPTVRFKRVFGLLPGVLFGRGRLRVLDRGVNADLLRLALAAADGHLLEVLGRANLLRGLAVHQRSAVGRSAVSPGRTARRASTARRAGIAAVIAAVEAGFQTGQETGLFLAAGIAAGSGGGRVTARGGSGSRAAARIAGITAVATLMEAALEPAEQTFAVVAAFAASITGAAATR